MLSPFEIHNSVFNGDREVTEMSQTRLGAYFWCGRDGRAQLLDWRRGRCKWMLGTEKCSQRR